MMTRQWYDESPTMSNYMRKWSFRFSSRRCGEKNLEIWHRNGSYFGNIRYSNMSDFFFSSTSSFVRSSTSHSRFVAYCSSILKTWSMRFLNVNTLIAISPMSHSMKMKQHEDSSLNFFQYNEKFEQIRSWTCPRLSNAIDAFMCERQCWHGSRTLNHKRSFRAGSQPEL